MLDSIPSMPVHQGPSAIDRFRGCLLGGAVGDALGAPVEFLSRARIVDHFGPDGITEYAPTYGGTGRVTDDTQMTLFTADGLLRAWHRDGELDPERSADAVAAAYLRWLRTQHKHPALAISAGEGDWLYWHRRLHHQRAPGTTCINALMAMPTLGAPAQNDSKGCGTVMRVAPVGLVGYQLRWSLHDTFQLGCMTARLTHGHPTGQVAAGAFAVLIQLLVAGTPLWIAVEELTGILRGERQQALVDAAQIPDPDSSLLAGAATTFGFDETLHAIDAAQKAAVFGPAPEDAIPALGGGWVAEEALAIAIYCTANTTGFDASIRKAVNHDGDSDSTGSMTGNLLGAMLGAEAIAPAWLEPLELRDVITEVADDLYGFVGPGDVAKYPVAWDKYPNT